MLRKLIQASAILALLTGTASSQTINMWAHQNPNMTAEEIEQRRQIDEDYRATMNKIPDKKKSTDPWGNVRSAPATSTLTKQQTR
jgi:hypothetical protein